MFKYNLDIKFTNCKTGRTHSIDVSLTEDSEIVVLNDNTIPLNKNEIYMIEVLNGIAIKELCN